MAEGGAGEPGEHLGDLGRGDGGHRGVDGHRASYRLGEAEGRRLERGLPPAGRLDVAVLEEGGELAPAGRALDEDRLAVRDAAERHAHRDRHDVHS